MTERRVIDPPLRPVDADRIRADCPVCGQPVVSNAYYTQGVGYVIWWECVGTLAPEGERTCTFRRVL